MTSPKFWKALFDRQSANRVFAVTIIRIPVAYDVGAMRCGLVVMSKQDSPESEPAREHLER